MVVNSVATVPASPSLGFHIIRMGPIAACPLQAYCESKMGRSLFVVSSDPGRVMLHVYFCVWVTEVVEGAETGGQVYKLVNELERAVSYLLSSVHVTVGMD